MDYFKLLNLKKEPFSNSPDPEFFFHSRQHLGCLQKLELSLLLRRGLNVVIGDVGTGKTTLCRQLIRRLAQKKEMETHLILDPHVHNAAGFLAVVAKMITGKKLPAGCTEWRAKEKIKQYLFHKGVKQGKTVVLILDEGQKIPPFCLEILREFLNYETNEYKLLQVVIFAQKEFEDTIRNYPNFADRINLYHRLKPLNFRDTRLMIQYRLKKSSGPSQNLNLFTFPALRVVYRVTGGYPRKINNLCHQSVLAMIIQNRSRCGRHLVNTCARRIFADKTRRNRLLGAGPMTLGALAMALLILISPARLQFLQNQGVVAWKAVFSEAGKQATGIQAAESIPRMAQARMASTVSAGRPKKPIDPARSIKTNPGTAANTLNDQGRPFMGLAAPSIAAPDIIEASIKAGAFAQSLKLPAKTTKAPRAAPVIQNSGDGPPPKQNQKTSYATILGQITLERNETLSRVIRGIYGAFNSKYFRSLIMANPDIEDPDRVEVGHTISLPAIPARVRPLNSPVWWVKIDERDTLEAAFNLLRRPPKNTPGVRLIPYWNPSDGTRFAVLVDKLFKDENTARNYLQQLPADLAAKSTILSKWEKETVYFSNPYFSRNHEFDFQ